MTEPNSPQQWQMIYKDVEATNCSGKSKLDIRICFWWEDRNTGVDTLEGFQDLARQDDLL